MQRGSEQTPMKDVNIIHYRYLNKILRNNELYNAFTKQTN